MRFIVVKVFFLYSLWVIDCRLNIFSENVIYVVIGERIEKDFEMLKIVVFRFVFLYNFKFKFDLWKIFFKLLDNICGKNIYVLIYIGINFKRNDSRVETWNDSSIFEFYNLYNDFRFYVVTSVWMAECFR